METIRFTAPQFYHLKAVTPATFPSVFAKLTASEFRGWAISISSETACDLATYLDSVALSGGQKARVEIIRKLRGVAS